ncbi:DoxX family protein [Parapedobacter tibetensis]|uniref:DoxX family protein n=1 Tax=Parapedobacter tibetensis TaxID=2972951 RepID=UPI00214D4EDC|nr:DoxX family protein [Parapedobacter tibetensis]
MEKPTDHLPRWTRLQRWAFRYFFIFFALYIFPFPLNSIPLVNQLALWYGKAWQQVVAWTGEHILHLPEPITIFRSGSGDKTYDHVFLLMVAVLSLLAASIWSLVDRHRTEYNRLLYWLRVYIRYYLAMMMMAYGVIKVLHLQMTSPSLFQLVQPFGDKSPMGLAWSYVGYSKAFSMFTGLAEVVGGALLFFRRTTLLGALLVAAVMFNVAIINFCFDIPVKLYSTLLFAMAVFLCLPDANRLLRVLVWNKPTLPAPNVKYRSRKHWLRIAFTVVKVCFIGFVVISQTASRLNGMKQYGDNRPKSPLYGIYDTELFVLAGDTLPPLTTDKIRWRQLIMDWPEYTHVKTMDNSLKFFNTSVDTVARRLTLSTGQNNVDKIILRCEQYPEVLQLQGVMKNDSVTIRLRKRDLDSFRLIGTKFRWVQEYPYNR